jgi:hypothetical protein
VKVLIVSEGVHDVGRRDQETGPRPARGVIPILARKICFKDDDELAAMHWQEIVRLQPDLRRKPAAKKIAAFVVASAVR